MSKELAEYEHPTDYVVIPVAMRDRIMARLNAAEATVAVLTRGIREHRDAILRSPGGGGGADHNPVLGIVLAEALKPCPFCGCSDVMPVRSWAFCTACHATADCWNRRTPEPQHTEEAQRAEQKVTLVDPVLRAVKRQAEVGWEIPPCLSCDKYKHWIGDWTARYLEVCGKTDAAVLTAARAAEGGGDE